MKKRIIIDFQEINIKTTEDEINVKKQENILIIDILKILNCNYACNSIEIKNLEN